MTSKPNTSKKLLICFLKATIIISLTFSLGIYLKSTPGYFIFLFLGGWLCWTFLEYGIHRFLMHELIIPGKKDTLFHHHEHHSDPSNLKIGIGHRVLILILGGLMIWIALQLNNFFSIFAGLFTGFLFYNLLHYLLHRPICRFIFPRIQRAHILHHTRYPNCGFSFSTILWDWLFDTLAPANVEITDKMKENYFNSFKKTIKEEVSMTSQSIQE